ncbi:YihY/virulence factor BrkB family protein [Sinomicrobium kalidii]|uniref:YihY/virulence factor BrkB family protein n=1 Tax=Sinomicrobium kalidii TaxID=2900738 RepID=UPI001E555F52|nr:YihY/virulence factor BrkB family protein [Sinomicrobium kalidii]UGU16332.1 YihY/virulence factor BrkB family protein [Sinomicrobium kalidii]
MSIEIEEKLAKIPVINLLVAFFKKIKLRAFEGLSVYDLLEMYVLGIVKGALTYRASAISFSFFMAIFPFLLFVLNLIPYMPVQEGEFLQFIDGLLPPETAPYFGDIFSDIASKKRGSLLSSVFILSIFLMTNGINAVFGGFETSYHVKISRNVIRQYFIALGVAVIMALLLLLSVAAFVFFQTDIIDELSGKGYIENVELWINIGKYLFFVFIAYLFTAILYYFGTAEGRDTRFFSPGALLTTILFVLTSYFFGIYIKNFSQYNELYGSIGALLILMLYIWLNSNILLLGFELNASLRSLKRKF